MVNIIGFDVDDAGQKALKKVADAGGGSYKSVDTEQDLSQYFVAAYEELRKKWREWGKENQQLIDKEDTTNQLLLFDLVRKDALGLLDTEMEHFNHAFKYMEKNGKVKSAFELNRKKSDRDKKIRSYFIGRINEIKPLIQKEQEKRMKEIDEIRRKKEEEIDQKIEDIRRIGRESPWLLVSSKGDAAFTTSPVMFYPQGRGDWIVNSCYWAYISQCSTFRHPLIG